MVHAVDTVLTGSDAARQVGKEGRENVVRNLRCNDAETILLDEVNEEVRHVLFLNFATQVKRINTFIVCRSEVSLRHRPSIPYDIVYVTLQHFRVSKSLGMSAKICLERSVRVTSLYKNLYQNASHSSCDCDSKDGRKG